MTTKFGSMVTWGHVTKQKPNIFFSRRSIATKCCRVLTCGEAKPKMKLYDSLITWSQEVICKIENILTYYVLFDKVFDHQTWQRSNLWWQEAPHGVTWPFNYAVLWDHVQNLKHNISFSARPMVSKLGRLVIEGEGAPPIEPHDRWIR